MKMFVPILVIGALIFLVHNGTFSSLLNGQVGSFAGATTSAHSGNSDAAHYSPGEDIEALDANAITNSTCEHLNIAMYSFTDWKLAEAVVAYANKGHAVHIYRDHEQYDQEAKRNSRVITMLQGNRNISIRVKASTVLMHVKSWSDGCVLRDGSANWSPSGEKQQDNTATFTANAQAIAAFESEFDLMWNRPDNIAIQ